MRKLAFIEGKNVPQSRSTQNVRFLFAHDVEYWQKIDEENAKKAEKGLLNRNMKPFKATRYAYRLARLQKLNSWRARVYAEVLSSCEQSIPTTGLYFFYLFKTPKSWSNKKKKEHYYKPHENKPDLDNLHKGVLDCLYENDSMVHTIFAHKMWIPETQEEGLLILQDEDFMEDVLTEIKTEFIIPKQD